MDTQLRFTVGNPKIISESFGDETIILNLGTGSYYSLDKIGAEIWQLIVGGHTKAQVAAVSCGRYEGEAARINEGISRFVAELQQEGLIAERAPEAAPTAEATILPADGPPEIIVFLPPVLNKYTDVQELLLLDPIHDVDEFGWPHKMQGQQPSSTVE